MCDVLPFSLLIPFPLERRPATIYILFACGVATKRKTRKEKKTHLLFLKISGVFGVPK